VCFFPTRDNSKALKNQVMVFILLNNYTDKKAYKSQFAEQLAIEKKATNADLMKESVSSQ
jgi:hypothetical protein